MRKTLLLPIAAAAVLGLAACGQKAKNEAIEANETISGDSNTMGEAVADTNAAMAQEGVFNATEAQYDSNAAAAGNEIFD